MKTGFVMESGAMRGMFTAGVTDVLEKFDVKTFNENRPILNPEFSFLFLSTLPTNKLLAVLQ